MARGGARGKRARVFPRLELTTDPICAPVRGPRRVGVLGNRYHALRAFPDGSVAFPAPGSGAQRVKIPRVLARDE